LERLALHQLHRQRAFFHAVDLSDVSVIERRQNFGFALESSHALRIGGKGIRQHFQRDFTLPLSVFRAINFAHSAGAEGRNDFIRAQAVTG
jgi:hypothetical protein